MRLIHTLEPATLGLALLLIPTGPTALAAQTPDFSAVDAHVEATPAAAEASVAALARYLARAGDTDLERARAAFYWVAANIAYDARGFTTGSYGDLSPEGVLRRREGVCSGYAGLAEALGEAMGLEIEVVNGWSKGYGYTAGAAVESGTNHAWNAVRINGEWRLMDPTWGAGYLDDRRQFVRRLQDHYFLTDPRAFLFDHYPEDVRWQLVDEPINRAHYGDLVFLRPHFFANGLEIRSHRRGRIQSQARLTVELGAPDTVALLAVLVDPETDQDLDRTRTFVQVAQGEARVDAVFPEPGSYILRLFVKPRDQEGSYNWALDYNVRAWTGEPDGDFPLAYSTFGQRDILLLEPMDGTLTAGEEYTFRLRAPGALGVAVVAGGDWHHLTAEEEDLFTGTVPAAEDDINVFARYEEGGQYQGLLKYTGR